MILAVEINKHTSRNCTRPNSPSSATHVYAASVCRNNCAKHISSLR